MRQIKQKFQSIPASLVKLCSFIFICCLAVLLGSRSFDSEIAFTKGKRENQSSAKRIFGLTVEDVSDTDEVINQLKFFRSQAAESLKPMVRVVFHPKANDPDGFDEKYLTAIRRMKVEADVLIMGELMDSFEAHSCIIRRSKKFNAEIDRQKSIDCYVNKTRNYLNNLNNLPELGDLVDVWEIGNEINGEWNGWREGEWENEKVTIADMENVRSILKEQIHEAYEILKNKPTALTLYFNNDNNGKFSYPQKSKRVSKQDRTERIYGEQHDMFRWLEDYAAQYRNDKFNYIFVSYWQDDNWAANEQGVEAPIAPDAAVWANIFKRFKDVYKNAQIGFGEVGTQCRYDNNIVTSCQPLKGYAENRNCSCCLWAQTEYTNRYYLMWDANIRQEAGKINSQLADDFVGGYFWWYFGADVVDKFSQAKNETLTERQRKLLRAEGEKTRTALLDALKRWREQPTSTNLFLYNAEEFAGSQTITKVLQTGDSLNSKPYTIVIINNPAYLENDGATIDPINKKPEMFAESVNYIYANLFGNLPHQAEMLLTEPVIKDKIRVVAVYTPHLPPDDQNALIKIDGQFVARQQEIFSDFFKRMNLYPDVVFVVTAYPQILRATGLQAFDDLEKGGVNFTFDGATHKHFYFTKIPGAVALHAINRSMTALHEFGHAASSKTEGYLEDLYTNKFNSDFVLNKKLLENLAKKYKRRKPKIFAEYNGELYNADNYRGKKAKKTIHAIRIDSRFPALMDDYTIIKNNFPEESQHDKLSRRFLLDRIRTKTERKFNE